MNEAETRAEHVDPALKAAGWGVVEASRILREYPITGGAVSRRRLITCSSTTITSWPSSKPSSGRLPRERQSPDWRPERRHSTEWRSQRGTRPAHHEVGVPGRITLGCIVQECVAAYRSCRGEMPRTQAIREEAALLKDEVVRLRLEKLLLNPVFLHT